MYLTCSRSEGHKSLPSLGFFLVLKAPFPSLGLIFSGIGGRFAASGTLGSSLGVRAMASSDLVFELLGVLGPFSWCFEHESMTS